MDELWTRPTGPLSVKSVRLKSIAGRLRELLTLTLDMLMIGAACLGVSLLTGVSEYVTMTAMGIAIYVSCLHFGLLRKEITALRSELARATTEPLAGQEPAGALERNDSPYLWQAAQYSPEPSIVGATARSL
jgi:hypothetical protein